ncbi:hypothetical protein BJY59DRAFT_711081 [Rhodotorula toruloides]
MDLTLGSISVFYGWAILYGDSPIHVSKGGLRACYSASCCLSLAGYTNILLVMACVFGYSPLEPQRKPQYRLVQPSPFHCCLVPPPKS